MFVKLKAFTLTFWMTNIFKRIVFYSISHTFDFNINHFFCQSAGRLVRAKEGTWMGLVSKSITFLSIKPKVDLLDDLPSVRRSVRGVFWKTAIPLNIFTFIVVFYLCSHKLLKNNPLLSRNCSKEDYFRRKNLQYVLIP